MARQPSPHFYESRKAWYVEINGKQILLAKGKGAKAEAHAVFHRLMADGAVPSKRNELSVEHLIDLFLDWCQSRVASETWVGYQRKLQSFILMYGKSRALDIRPMHVSRWLDSHDWNDTTKCGYVTAVKRSYSWARKQGHIELDPVIDSEKPSPSRRTKVLTAEQYRTILAHIDTPRRSAFRDLIVGLWETGCRPSELVTLTADRVEIDRRRWIVLNKTRKATGRPTRRVMLTDPALELSRRLLKRRPEGLVFVNHRGRAWTWNAMACMFADIRTELGYGAEVTAYAFRHRYGTDALLNGMEVATVATLMGHTSTTMVMRHYSHLDEEDAHLLKATLSVRPGESSAVGHASAEPCATPPAPELPREPRTTQGIGPDPPS